MAAGRARVRAGRHHFRPGGRAPIVAVWATAGFQNSGFDVLARLAGQAWLLIHGVPLLWPPPAPASAAHPESGHLSLIPLGLTLIPFLLAWRAGRRLARASYTDQLWQALLGSLAGLRRRSACHRVRLPHRRRRHRPLVRRPDPADPVRAGHGGRRAARGRVLEPADRRRRRRLDLPHQPAFALGRVVPGLGRQGRLRGADGGLAISAGCWPSTSSSTGTLWSRSMKGSAPAPWAAPCSPSRSSASCPTFVGLCAGLDLRRGIRPGRRLNGRPAGHRRRAAALRSGVCRAAVRPAGYGFVALVVPALAGVLAGWWFLREGENHFDEWLSIKIRARWFTAAASTLVLGAVIGSVAGLLAAGLAWLARGSAGHRAADGDRPRPLLHGTVGGRGSGDRRRDRLRGRALAGTPAEAARGGPRGGQQPLTRRWLCAMVLRSSATGWAWSSQAASGMPRLPAASGRGGRTAGSRGSG